MSYLRQTAIVLKKKTVRHGDRWYTLLTATGGKSDVLVKSAAQSNSKLAGHLEPGVRTEVMLAPGRAITHLAGAKLQNAYGGSNPDFSLLLTKLAALRVVDNLVYGSEASEQIFSLVDKFLTVLVADEFSSSQQRALLYIFTMEALLLVGLGPNLTNAKKYDYFDPAAANFVPELRPDNFFTSSAVKKLLNLFFSRQVLWEEKLFWLKKIKYDRVIFSQLEELLNRYYDYHVGSPIIAWLPEI